MIIEEEIIKYLSQRMDCLVVAEQPADLPERFVIVQKTNGGMRNRLRHPLVAVQSYGNTLYDAAQLNEAVIANMDEFATAVSGVSGCSLNSDYNFTDPAEKRYRYQAVFNITHCF